MKPTRLTFTSNEAWRAERAKSIGASEVGVLIGENYFTTPMQLAEKKKNELKGIFDFEETEAMQDGHDLEEFVARKFSRRTHLPIIKASAKDYILRREDIPFMHASPDRTYWIDQYGKQNDDNKGLLECKTTWRPIDKDDLPMSWQFQLQVQMGIGGFKEGYLAWWQMGIHDGFDYKWFAFQPEVFEAAVELCRNFWDNCVMGDQIPDPVNSDDVVRRYPDSDPAKTIQATGTHLQLIEEIKEKKNLIKQLETEVDEAKDMLAICFDDAESMTNPNTGKVVVTFKTSKPRVTVDSKKLKADYPDIYAECSKESKGSRTMLIK